MRKILAAAALALSSPAWGQTWSNDQFTVSTDNLTAVTITGGTADVDYLPAAISNPGAGSFFPTTDFDLDFAAQPGYKLLGERLDFGVQIDNDLPPPGSDMVILANGSFAFGINGQYSLSKSGDGGIQQYDGTFLLLDPHVRAQLDETVNEGIACPAGHSDNGCNDGIDAVFLQSLVFMTSFSITPIITPIPEPGTSTLLLTALGSLALAAAARRRHARP